ncbi:thiolase family protein [Pseudarthrobacter sp. PS3-L1]|uniref:thiolase family protein n=1 Tax=Pseudarthrobacter sp. PS3-L1 TaxID=3046207 RepID=UPI0024B9BC76|nr:thiolase family protein [Pseudarthrobacter sp. PS3-L1]MDJ0320201.1 thiolase family protein [Pseudarthrobacter sp. PS3-L1]
MSFPEQAVQANRQPIIIAARRTPICRTRGRLAQVPVERLLAPVLAQLLRDCGVAGPDVDDVVIGNATGGGGNVARLALLTAGLPVSVPGISVDRQCTSGLDAITLAAGMVAGGTGTLFLAGGAESISTAPLRARPGGDGEPVFFSRAAFTPPEFGDPEMGTAAENVAVHSSIGRERQDAFALESHQRAAAALSAGRFRGELITVDTATGPVTFDDGPRSGLTPGIMQRFPPVFVPGGSVTAGNSCSDADAAAAVVVTSLAHARGVGAADGLEVLGWASRGVEPRLLGLGAAAAGEAVLTQCGVDPGALTFVEFNEAFAAQALASLDVLGIDPARANRDGGALALGHAYGASGAVLVVRLFAQARASRQPGALGLALISGAGGMGTAILVRYVRLA